MINLLDALKARIPLIRVANNDPVNLTSQLKVLAAHAQFAGSDEVTDLSNNALASNNNYLLICYLNSEPTKEHYNIMESTGSTMVFVGAADDSPLVMDIGAHYPSDQDLVIGLQRGCRVDHALAQSMVNSLKGLTILQANAVGKVVISQARDHQVLVSHDMLAHTRAAMMGNVTGLEILSREQPFYAPDRQLYDWTQWAIKASAGRNYKLRPRGILLHGQPGTGKTCAALYVAKVFNRPLVRLDIPAMLTRWQGDAERSLRTALQAVETLAPAVLLIDEVEKVLSRSAGDDTTRRLMGQMLWWLAMHGSPVIVVMTANDKDAIPPELIRDGRLDEVIDVKELQTPAELGSFVNGVMGNYAGMINPQTIDFGQAPYNQSRVTRLIEKAVAASGN